jgi:molecular chaperone GrpE
MTEEHGNDVSEETEQEAAEDIAAEPEKSDTDELKKSLEEANDKYIRLYADFENYKKVTAKNKEDLLKYANEDIMSDILTVIDHLELALQHSTGDETSSSLAEGVELTLKELKGVLEKHGLVRIDAMGKQFDPAVHHAMSQIETEDAEEDTVVKEFRKGYMLRDRVLRAPLVGVAKKKTAADDTEEESTEDQTVANDENNNN